MLLEDSRNMLAHSAATQIGFLPYSPYARSPAKTPAPHVPSLKALCRASQVWPIADLCRSKASQNWQEKMYFFAKNMYLQFLSL